MQAEALPKPKAKRKWKRWVLVVLALLVTPLFLAVSRSESPAPSAPPSATEAVAARKAFEQLRRLAKEDRVQQAQLSWDQLASISKLGGRAFGIDNAAIVRDGSRVKLMGSRRLPLGLWANGSLWASAAKGTAPELEGRIGSLPVPPLVMRWLIQVGRYALQRKGIEVPPPDALIHGMSVGDDGVVATVELPRESALVQALGGAGQKPIDPATVSRRYCALTAAQNAKPATAFPTLLKRAIGGGRPGEERAALVALAMITVSPEVGRMVGDVRPFMHKCVGMATGVTLSKREDLPKHWALSAALSATYGADISAAMGTWKEVADSGKGGSGFSYVDLAADRSGSLVGELLSDPTRAGAMRAWLAEADEGKLLPIHELALAEGLDEAEFRRRYASTESAAYAKQVARIDRVLRQVIGQ